MDFRTTTSLATTVTHIEGLWRVKSWRLYEDFPDVREQYDEVLRDWVDFISILSRFQADTGFVGDQEIWENYFESLSPQNIFWKSALKHILKANFDMGNWFLKRKSGFDFHSFCGDVANILLSLAGEIYCMDNMTKEMFKEQITDFNQSVKQWFYDPA